MTMVTKEIAKLTVGGHTIELTNLEKVFWPEEKYIKGDMLEYYQEIASTIIPYLKNRPLVLHRFPNGINEEGFYQKNMTEPPPSWIKTVGIQHENREIKYIVVQDEASLLYVANLGSIELHPFLSQISHLDNPDFLVFDLDPENVSLEQVVVVAKTLHEILDDAKIKNFCKTSGGKGLHVHVPLHGEIDYETSKKIGLEIAKLVFHEHPEIISLDRISRKTPSKQRKVHIDILRNSLGQTVVAPYSVRPRPGAPVSTPLEWDEVKKKLDPLKFNIKTVVKRVNEVGDIFKPVLGKANIKGLKKFLMQ